MDFLFENNDFISAGQPTVEQFKELHSKGYEVCINMRSSGEDDFNPEETTLGELGVKYYNIPFFDQDNSISKENLDKISDLFKSHKTKILIHCKSANRVGAWYYYFLRSEGVLKEDAHKNAVAMGLTKLELMDKLETFL
jgi:protein tyrosine phosphatase (PTP) superfamily phosphohydrolase (DUF442 family)